MFKKLFATALLLGIASAFAAVDVNKATQAELESVKGIGPALSTKLVDERKKAPFKDWSDMRSRVKGVGDRKAAKLSAEGLAVNGAVYAQSAPTVPAVSTKIPAVSTAKPAAPKK